MGVFEAIGAGTHEEVVFGQDPDTGLKTIIAIHSTVLGPALGGARFFSYASESDALHDVLRLSNAMTYKSAAAGLDLGGGKAVIIGDPRQIKTEVLLRAFGRIVASLGGRYITAEDIGTSAADMVVVRRETAHVSGLPSEHGGSGDPSPATARGVMAALRTVASRIWGDEDLAGRTVAVQGIGKVGSSLVERLTKVRAEVIVTDVDEEALEAVTREYGVTVVEPDAIFDVECDVFAPCAMGAVLNERTIPRLTCAAVAGSANNQLATPEDGRRLEDKGILYAPDFIVNAGGIINIGAEVGGYDWRKAATAVDAIAHNLDKVFRIADDEGIDPATAAVQLAADRIEAVGSLKMRMSNGGNR